MISVAGVEDVVVITGCGFGGPERKLRIIAAPFLFQICKNQQLLV